jgi:hypothetical protein
VESHGAHYARERGRTAKGVFGMINLVTEFLPKMLGHVLPVAIRWYYTPEKLADRVKVRVCEDRDGLSYWGGELPQARAWVRVTNLTPFPLLIDRIYGNFRKGDGFI